MRKNISLIINSVLVVGILAACSPFAGKASSEVTRSVSVNGIGKVTIVPDIAMVNIGVRTEAEVITAALDGNSAQANAISKALQAMGIDEKDIQTSNFNIYPNDRWNPMTGEIEGQGFVVENTVNVTVRDLSSLGQVLNVVVDAGANSIYGISFDVADRSAAVAEARDLAIQDAQVKASAIADSAGVQLGEIISISVYEGHSYYPYYDSMGGGATLEAASVPISAGTLTITMESHLTYAID